MPTTMPPKRRPRSRDHRLELAMVGVSLLLVIALSIQAAGARSAEEETGRLGWLNSPTVVTCTAAAVPCALLAP